MNVLPLWELASKWQADAKWTLDIMAKNLETDNSVNVRKDCEKVVILSQTVVELMRVLVKLKLGEDANDDSRTDS